MTASGNKLIDAVTTLVGWINYSATDPFERTRVSAEIVRLSVPLDTVEHFTLLFSHPGAAAAVTAVLQVAPLLKDGTTGTWVTAATVAIPAAGGQIEATISGGSLVTAAGDLANVVDPCFFFARATLTPSTPAGAHVSLTHG